MKRQRSTKFNSRQYMLAKDYEIFYYSDVNFQSVGSHSHDYYEFYFFESGAVSMEIGSSVFPLKQGDVIIVPPGVRHRAVVLDPSLSYRRFVFWISRSYLSALSAQAQEYGYPAKLAEQNGQYVFHFDLLTFNTIRAQLFSLLDELHAEHYGKQESIRIELQRLLLLLSRLIHEQTKSSRRETRNKYAQISAYIDEHLDEPLSLEQLAGEFYLSKYYIAHLFRESTGLSVHQYLTKKRLAAVCAAMQSGEPVSEACFKYGFQEYSSFYRAFRKEYGISPSSFRELHRIE